MRCFVRWFVCWLVREAMRTDGPYTFARPTTAGAWDLENWSKKQDNSTHTLRNPGNDIKAVLPAATKTQFWPQTSPDWAALPRQPSACSSSVSPRSGTSA